MNDDNLVLNNKIISNLNTHQYNIFCNELIKNAENTDFKDDLYKVYSKGSSLKMSFFIFLNKLSKVSIINCIISLL